MKFNLSRFEWSNKAVEKLAFRHGTLSTIDSSYISIWVYIDLISSTNNDSSIVFVMEFRFSFLFSFMFSLDTLWYKYPLWKVRPLANWKLLYNLHILYISHVCRIFSHIEDSCFKVNGLFSATNNEPVMGLYLQQSNRIDSVRIHARQYKDSITE